MELSPEDLMVYNLITDPRTETERQDVALMMDELYISNPPYAYVNALSDLLDSK